MSLQGLQETFKEASAQLRVEMQHWKEQCQRLEQEKVKLALKYDALVAEQLVCYIPLLYSIIPVHKCSRLAPMCP